jgi:hypothetical protein
MFIFDNITNTFFKLDPLSKHFYKNMWSKKYNIKLHNINNTISNKKNILNSIRNNK